MASEDAAEGKRGIHLPSGKGSAAAHMGKSWFFGIGINEYAHFPRLHNAVKDVQDVLALLQSQYDLDDEAIILLFDQEATRQKIIQGFRRLVHEVKPADKLIIYYSGHGHFDKESNLAFWIPQDANPGDDSGYIPNSTVRDYIRAIGSLHTFLISDSCFSGTFFVRGVSRSGTAQEELERIPSRWGLCRAVTTKRWPTGPRARTAPSRPAS